MQKSPWLQHPITTPLWSGSKLWTNRFTSIDRLPIVCVLYALVFCVALSPVFAHASLESEIEFLFGYIETSGCTFTRNGVDHDSQEAGEHIRRKYGHTKKWIKTAEDFIRLTATKSSISGQPYVVTCNGKTIPTSQWLNQALLRFRKNGPESPPSPTSK